MRVTADTNIFISGLNFRRGKPFHFLELARAGTILLSVSEAILAEVSAVLSRKFDFTPEEIAGARSFITGMARVVRPTVELAVIREDPADNRIPECAVTAGAEFIVPAGMVRQHSRVNPATPRGPFRSGPEGRRKRLPH